MSESAPVFVDPSGRRARRARLAGGLVAVVCFGYLLMVAFALVASPGVLRLAVPGLGGLLPNAAAPPIADGGGTRGRPAALLTGAPVPRTTATASATPTPTTAVPVTTNPAGRPLPTQRQGSGPPQPANTPAASPTATATTSPEARRTGKPTAPPGADKPPPARGPGNRTSP